MHTVESVQGRLAIKMAQDEGAFLSEVDAEKCLRLKCKNREKCFDSNGGLAFYNCYVLSPARELLLLFGERESAKIPPTGCPKGITELPKVEPQIIKKKKKIK